MILWLASYPKSGNTLLRSLLSAYFYSKDGLFNFELLKNIPYFPSHNFFKNLIYPMAYFSLIYYTCIKILHTYRKIKLKF